MALKKPDTSTSVPSVGRSWKPKVAGVVAGTATAALFLTSTTSAFWSDAVNVEGGTISAGNLDVEMLDRFWQDVSADRTLRIIPSIAEARIIPGDTFRMTQDLDVALWGDNLLATVELKAADAGNSGDLFGNDLVSATYKLVRKDNGEQVIPETSALTSSTPLNLSKEGLTQKVDGSADYALVVDVKFSDKATARELAQKAGELNKMEVEVRQVRKKLAEGLVVNKEAVIEGDKLNKGVLDAGEKLAFRYTAFNQGETMLRNVSVNDPILSSKRLKLTPTKVAFLPPGNSVEFKTTAFEPTAAELENKVLLESEATAVGFGTVSEPASTSVATTPIVVSGSLDVVGSVSGGFVNPGDTVTYDYTFKNTSSVELKDVRPVGGSTRFSFAPASAASVTPGATVTFRGTTTAPGDGGGTFDSTHSVTAVPTFCDGGFDCDRVTVASSESSLTAGLPSGSISTTASSSTVTQGETVTLTHTLRNTGKMELKNVRVVTSGGTTSVMVDSIPAGGTATVNTTATPGATTNYTSTFYGTPTGRSEVELGSSATAVVVQAPTYTASMSTSQNYSSVSNGTMVTFTHTIRNTGNQTLYGIYVDNSSGSSSSINGKFDLAPGAVASVRTSAVVNSTTTYTSELYAANRSGGPVSVKETNSNIVTVDVNTNIYVTFADVRYVNVYNNSGTYGTITGVYKDGALTWDGNYSLNYGGSQTFRTYSNNTGSHRYQVRFLDPNGIARYGPIQTLTR